MWEGRNADSQTLPALLTDEVLPQPKGNCWKRSRCQTLVAKHTEPGDEHTEQLKGSENIVAGPPKHLPHLALSSLGWEVGQKEHRIASLEVFGLVLAPVIDFLCMTQGYCPSFWDFISSCLK